MQPTHLNRLAIAVATLLLGAAVFADSLPAEQTKARVAPRPARPRPPQHAAPAIPSTEPEVTATPNAGFATASAFTTAQVQSGVSPNTALTPPVTIAYAGASSVLMVSDTGTGKAVQATISNTANSSSALYGQTNGGGAGLTGYNGGTKGPAGKFVVTNAASPQAGAFASTNGTGSALLATVTNGASTAPAIYGQNPPDSGIGVEGDGGNYGVYGSSPTGYGVYGFSAQTGNGVVGSGTSGNGVYGFSTGANGVYGSTDVQESEADVPPAGVFGQSTNEIGVFGQDSGNGIGVQGTSVTGLGVLGEGSTIGVSGIATTGGMGVQGQSASGVGVSGTSLGKGDGVYGFSDSGYGVHGASSGSYAGYFDGAVSATRYDTSSDRNAKAAFAAVDEAAVLDKVRRLPVSSWTFKNDPGRRHVGPMAQDFHDEFALNGTDDTRINLADLAGVSLAAIQELDRRVQDQAVALQQKDAQIADLKHEVEAMAAEFTTLRARLEGAPAEAARVARTQ